MIAPLSAAILDNVVVKNGEAEKWEKPRTLMTLELP